jgi:hypothetical protein
MSGVRPNMISAPRVTIKINGQPVAYAIGLSLNVGVSINPVYAIGSFQAVSLEPVMYAPVSGVLQVIRLSSPASRDAAKAGAVANNANSLSEQKTPYDSFVNSSEDNAIINQSGLHAHLDPNLVLASATFDIEIYIKYPKSAELNADGTIRAGGAVVEDVFSFMTLKDCRITGRNTNISMGTLVNEPLSYTGLLAVNTTLDKDNQEQLDYFADNT